MVHPEPAPNACGGDGQDCWQTLEPSTFMVHSSLLPTGRVLMWAGVAEGSRLPLEGNAMLWDPATLGRTQLDIPDDLFCAHHTMLADGRFFIVGGDSGGGQANPHSYLFTQDPATPDTGTFAFSGDMAQNRWYPTAVRLGDGRVLAVSGWFPLALEVEVYDPATETWSIVSGATRAFPGLYPGLHLIPSGEIFYTRTSWNPELAGTQTAYLTMTGPTSAVWTDYGQQEIYDRQEGMSLQMIDTTVDPPKSRIYVVGGGPGEGGHGPPFPPPEARAKNSMEFIEFNGGIAGSAWQRAADMSFDRTNVNAVALPTGDILVVGGESQGGRFVSDWAADYRVGPVETYDPESDSWTIGASLAFHHGYHSEVVVLPDGRVLATGGEITIGRTMELYSPSYLNQGPRPVIADAPDALSFGEEFSIETSNGKHIRSVSLLALGSVTHHTDSAQRYIKLPIKRRSHHGICSVAPANGNIAPPGDYMLFVVDRHGIPSTGRFVRITL